MRRPYRVLCLATLIAIVGASLGASRLVAAEGPSPRAAIYIVSDPRLSPGHEAELAMTTMLLSLRQKCGIEGSLLPVNTYHLDSSEEAAFAHDRLKVNDTQVPFVGLAELNASGQPQRFLLRLGPVHNASAASRAIFAQVSQLFGQNASLLKDLPPVTAHNLTLPVTADGLAQPNSRAVAEGPTTIVTRPDQAEMVLIPGSEFIMGSNIMDDEEPSRTLFLSPYYIDRYAVTNRQFELFVQATHYVTDAERKGFSIVFIGGEPVARNLANWRQPLGPGSSVANYQNHPVVHVSWNDAEAYAGWANKRLPTEMEWEKAARGMDGREYPWGAGADESRSNSRYFQKGDIIRTMNPLDHDRGTIPVGSLPDGASPYGVMDMGGNVEEWVEDWYHAYPGNTRPIGEGEGSDKVKRGGGWNDEAFWSSYRAHSFPTFSSDETGFRTCRSVHPEDVTPPQP